MVQLGQEPTDAEVESIMTTADTNGNKSPTEGTVTCSETQTHTQKDLDNNQV